MLEKYIGDEDVSCIVQTVYSNCNQAKKKLEAMERVDVCKGVMGSGTQGQTCEGRMSPILLMVYTSAPQAGPVISGMILVS